MSDSNKQTQKICFHLTIFFKELTKLTWKHSEMLMWETAHRKKNNMGKQNTYKWSDSDVISTHTKGRKKNKLLSTPNIETLVLSLTLTLSSTVRYSFRILSPLTGLQFTIYAQNPYITINIRHLYQKKKIIEKFIVNTVNCSGDE